MVDPRARRQDRRDPGRHQRDMVPGEERGDLHRPVRRALRPRARPDARVGRGHVERRVRRVARRAARRAGRGVGRARPGRVGRRLREVPRPERRGRHRPAHRRLPHAHRSRWRSRASSARGAARCPPSARAGPTSKSRCSSTTSRRARRVAARAEPAPAWQSGKVASWLVTTDHKRIGILYIATSLVFLVLAGLDGARHAPPARAGERGHHRAGSLQRARHDPRNDDGVPRRSPDPRRVRELPRAAHDRHLGHGVPASERALVLVLRASAAPCSC